MGNLCVEHNTDLYVLNFCVRVYMKLMTFYPFSVLVTSVDTTAVLTGVARLPCDLQPSAPSDKVTLVIWYKDSGSKPIYR
jgi:hypothetical protein